MIDPARTPVIAAIGEALDRPTDLTDALEPLALMEAALRRAVNGLHGDVLGRVDSIDVVNLISWPYAAPADQLCIRLGIWPARRHYGAVGGETPVRFVHAAAARIARGESDIAVICGGEAHLSAGRAAARDVALDWTPPPAIAAPSIRGQDTAHPLAKAIGAHLPVTVYPLYDNATAHGWCQRPDTALRESAALWARMSAVAARNPHSWDGRSYSADEIATAGPDNRIIAWPYRKRMVANIGVNMGGALVVMSLATARELGLDDGRLAFVQGGHHAKEPDDYLLRDSYAGCVARDAVLDAALTIAPHGFDHVELYSCFPVVPKASRRRLALDDLHPCTVTGGLTFFGAPLNNYMTHATAAMVRALQDMPGIGLLYGQGGFMTKHATLVLSSRPAEVPWVGDEGSVMADVATRYGAVPRFDDRPDGAATLETFTVVHDRKGARRGVVVARTDQGKARTLARVDEQEIAMLEDDADYPIGRPGRVSTGGDGIPTWRFA